MARAEWVLFFCDLPPSPPLLLLLNVILQPFLHIANLDSEARSQSHTITSSLRSGLPSWRSSWLSLYESERCMVELQELICVWIFAAAIELQADLWVDLRHCIVQEAGTYA